MSGHQVKTRLTEPDGIGPFTLRQCVVIGVGGFVAFNLYDKIPHDGPTLGHLIALAYPDLGWMEGLMPAQSVVLVLAAVAIVALCWPMSPPPEHGLFKLLSYLRARRTTHGLRSPVDVGDDIGNPIVRTDEIVSDFGYHAVWELPSVNLRLFDDAEIEVAEGLLGEFYQGAPCNVQTITLATRIDAAKLVGEIASHPRPQAKRLATWLKDQALGEGLVERRHFVAVCETDEVTFRDTCIEIERGVNNLGLRAELVNRLEGKELAAVVKRTWSIRKASLDSLGPDGTWDERSRQVHSDGEWHEVVTVSRLPRVIQSNFLGPYIDGQDALDVVTHTETLDPDGLISTVERRMNAMAASGKTIRRGIAITDMEDFARALGKGEEQPFNASIYFHVHHPDRAQVDREARRVIQRLRRVGARGANLRWEQADALQSVAALGVNHLDGRSHTVDTSTVKRIYPMTASAMWPEGSVPWGQTLDSKRAVGYTGWRRPMISNPQLFVAALSGGGKGFGIKVLESRSLFAGVTDQLFGFDQAEEDDDLGEYGKFAAYCGLEYRMIRRLSDLDACMAELRGGSGVIWNIASLSMADRPEVMVKAQRALWQLAKDHPAKRKLIVDELWSWAVGAEQMDADPHMVALAWGAIEQIIRVGRHMQIGGDWMTQRLKDCFVSPLLDIVQSQCASQMYGLMKAAEISECGSRLGWTRAEEAAIKKFTPGQFLLTAGPWRVTMRVVASREEYAMAATDGKVSNAPDSRTGNGNRQVVGLESAAVLSDDPGNAGDVPADVRDVESPAEAA